MNMAILQNNSSYENSIVPRPRARRGALGSVSPATVLAVNPHAGGDVVVGPRRRASQWPVAGHQLCPEYTNCD